MSYVVIITLLYTECFCRAIILFDTALCDVALYRPSMLSGQFVDVDVDSSGDAPLSDGTVSGRGRHGAKD